MKQKVIVGRYEIPYVSVKSTDDLVHISKKSARVVRTLEAMVRLEDKMMSGQDKRLVVMSDIMSFADDIGDLSDDMINIARGLKSKVSDYHNRLG